MVSILLNLGVPIFYQVDLYLSGCDFPFLIYTLSPNLRGKVSGVFVCVCCLNYGFGCLVSF